MKIFIPVLDEEMMLKLSNDDTAHSREGQCHNDLLIVFCLILRRFEMEDHLCTTKMTCKCVALLSSLIGHIVNLQSDAKF